MQNKKDFELTFYQTLGKYLRVSPDNSNLNSTHRLSDLGLDSLSTVDLVLELEDTFDIVIPDELLTSDNFESPQTLMDSLRSVVLSKG